MLYRAEVELENIEVEAIWTTEQREEVEDAFKQLLEQYGISDHYNTLLYISLAESNDADAKYQHIWQTYGLAPFNITQAAARLSGSPAPTQKAAKMSWHLNGPITT